MLAYLAAQVLGMYLGTSIFLLPPHHPVMVVEYISTLDNLSGGKVLFGVGHGYRENEFNSCGIDKRQRRGRLVEGLDVIRKLWTGESVTFHGEHFHLESQTCRLSPHQLEVRHSLDRKAKIDPLHGKTIDLQLTVTSKLK